MDTEKMMDQIRTLVGQCTDAESTCLNALVAEAEGWELRLGELDAEEEEADDGFEEDPPMVSGPDDEADDLDDVDDLED